jgi:hypothetical protein
VSKSQRELIEEARKNLGDASTHVEEASRQVAAASSMALKLGGEYPPYFTDDGRQQQPRVQRLDEATLADLAWQARWYADMARQLEGMSAGLGESLELEPVK